MQLTRDFPDPARKGVVLSSEYRQEKVEEILESWTSVPWPDGLLSYSIYQDADGDLICDYSQWTDEEELDNSGRAGARYHLYRGSRSADGRMPGAMVAVRVDTDSAELARTWVDAVFEALERDRNLPAGGIGAFFHISTDGRQVLNYAEWETAEDHRRALAANSGSVSAGPLWDRVRTMPEVRQVSVIRYLLHATLTP
jgi:hypothetical protein